MNRRGFLAGAISTCLAMPLTGEAQQAGKVYRIGLLAHRPVPYLVEPFVAGLVERGWVDGRDILLEARFAGADQERAAALVTELLDVKVDVIVTVVTGNAVAARRMTSTVPIVMLTSGYPVEAGLAASLGRPGGNVTGNSIYAGGELFGKYMEILSQIVPGMARLAVFWDYVPPMIAEAEGNAAAEELGRAARALGFRAHVREVRTQEEFDRALATTVGDKPDALFATSGPIHAQPQNASQLVAISLKHRVPMLTDFAGGLFRAGALATYSASPAALGRRAAYFVDRILRGATPGDLPIERPSKFELTINLKTARALGLTIPPSLLLRADQVIE